MLENVTKNEWYAYEVNESKCERLADSEVSNVKSFVAPRSVFGVCADIPFSFPREGRESEVFANVLTEDQKLQCVETNHMQTKLYRFLFESADSDWFRTKVKVSPQWFGLIQIMNFRSPILDTKDLKCYIVGDFTLLWMPVADLDCTSSC